MSIARLSVFVYRDPCPVPVATSFGVMRDRPAVFVRVEAADGAFGWGEIFANWPAAGAEHRARLLIEDIAPLVLGRPSDAPETLTAGLTAQTHIRALQCGEQGPFAQVIAGLDTALCDLCARRQDKPLAQWLTKDAAQSVPAYASGIAIADAAAHIPAARARGIGWFKLKVGFDMARDIDALRKLDAARLAHETLCADANQAWSHDEARLFVQHAPPLAWLEEPLAVDRPLAEWQSLAQTCATPLAGGENFANTEKFAKVIVQRGLQVIQPDVAKWGGVTGCYAVARQTVSAGLTYCPHFLGGGIGLLASAHLLAAAQGPGLLELDMNTNLTRAAFFDDDPVVDGRFHLTNAPGLGIENLPAALDPLQTLSVETHL
ncbi:MAG: mandelate racemase/muconate lactonizing enzyme family protein [Roseobacter sp.]